MTAVPSWDIVGDAELARAAAAGDRRAFARIYDRYADRLHDFCVGMLADRDAAADCVQDAFCVAATSLANLREPDKLRPWLYGIARHHAMRRIRDRRREQVSDDLPDVTSPEAGPDTLAGRTELANLIAEAAGGLSDRDRAVLELAYRHGLDGPELASALGVSLTNANTMVYRLRETIERCLGALLVARRAQRNPNGCPELGAILKGWDGRFTILMRKRIARHIESCPSCEQERRRLVNPVALLGAVPVFIPAPDWLRGQTLSHIQLTSAGSRMGSTADRRGESSRMRRDAASPRRSPPSAFADATRSSDAAAGETLGAGGIPALQADRSGETDHHRSRRVMLLVALVVGVPLTCLGLTLAWLHHQSTPVTPTPSGVSGTAPKSSNGAPGGQLPAGPAPNKLAPRPSAGTNTAVPAPAAPTRGATPILTPAPVPPIQAPAVDSGTAPPPPALVPPTPVSVPPVLPTAPVLPAPAATPAAPPNYPPSPPPTAAPNYAPPPPSQQLPTAVIGPPPTSVSEPPH